MKSDIEVIDGAISLIEKDGGWCRGSYCRDKKGKAVGFYSEGVRCAVSFCVQGAIRYSAGYSVYDHLPQESWDQVHRLDTLAVQMIPRPKSDKEYLLSLYNDEDSTTQEDVVLLLKLVRSHLEEQV